GLLATVDETVWRDLRANAPTPRAAMAPAATAAIVNRIRPGRVCSSPLLPALDGVASSEARRRTSDRARPTSSSGDSIRANVWHIRSSAASRARASAPLTSAAGPRLPRSLMFILRRPRGGEPDATVGHPGQDLPARAQHALLHRLFVRTDQHRRLRQRGSL